MKKFDVRIGTGLLRGVKSKNVAIQAEGLWKKTY
jgi:hypothetical protein